VFDRFKHNGGVYGVGGPVAFLERAETHLQSLVRSEEVNAQPLTGAGQHSRINIYAQNPNKLVVFAQPLQQFSAAAAKIGHMTCSRGNEGFDDSIQAGAMQSRCH